MTKRDDELIASFMKSASYAQDTPATFPAVRAYVDVIKAGGSFEQAMSAYQSALTEHIAVQATLKA